MAEQQELDLVEISPNAEPPVCKIMDYKKFLYEQKKRDKILKPSRKSASDRKPTSMTMNLKRRMPKSF